MPVNRLGLVAIITAHISTVALLTAASAGAASGILFAQGPNSQIQASLSVSGQVFTKDKAPVSAAHVTLQSPDASTLESTISDSAGRFTFKLTHPGPYIITCDQGRLRSYPLKVKVENMALQDLRLIIDRVETNESKLESNPGLPGGTIKFSDKPNFSVAGVTDWTAVGGHGSDATLRTSEDLTRKTLALRPPLPERDSSGEPQRISGDANVEANLRAAFASAPGDYQANHNLGAYYSQTGRFQLAIPFLQTASKLHGNGAEDEYQLAITYNRSGAFVEAKKHLQLALSKADSANVHHLMGDVEEKLGDPLSAVQQLERATQLAPTEQNYFDWASELLLHRAIWQAAEVFAVGTRAHPASIRLKTGRGAALFAASLYAEAAQQLCEVSDLDPAAVEPYVSLGKIASASQVLPVCIQPRLKRFLDLKPTNPDANYLYATLLLKQGSPLDVHEAEILLRNTVTVDPNCTEAYLQLGILSFKRSDFADAKESFLRAIQANPKQGEAHYRLGVVYDRLGQHEQAREQFALHDSIERAETEATERERRQVKQFLITLRGDQAVPDKL